MTGLEPAILCLAMNIFFEARNEPVEGQLAVALVTMTRVVERQKTVCKVVFESKQFSWTITEADKHGHLLPHARDKLKGQAWLNAQILAQSVHDGHVVDFTGGANYFYADYIPIPRHLIGAEFKGKFGRHYFYRLEK